MWVPLQFFFVCDKDMIWGVLCAHNFVFPLFWQNVFMTKSGQIKLGDFGLSTVLKNTMAQANTLCGTPYYFSPGASTPYAWRSKICDAWFIWKNQIIEYPVPETSFPHKFISCLCKNHNAFLNLIFRSTLRFSSVCCPFFLFCRFLGGCCFLDGHILEIHIWKIFCLD